MEPDKKTTTLNHSTWLQPTWVKYLLWFVAAAWVYTLSFIINNYWSEINSYESVTVRYQRQLQKKEQAFQALLKNEDLLKRIAFGTATDNDYAQLGQAPFGFFLYHNASQKNRLVFWSNNAVLPPAYVVNNGVHGSEFRHGNGQYEVLRQKITVNGLPYTAIGLVLLHQAYFIENAKLHNEFPGFPGLEGRMLYSNTPTSHVIKGITGEPLFYFKPGLKVPFKVFSWSGVLVQIIATFMIILGISRIASDYFKTRHTIKGLLAFSVGFTLLWIGVKKLGVPLNIGHLGLMEGQNMLALPPDTLLTLVQNSLFGIWLALFLTVNTNRLAEPLKWLSRPGRAAVAGLLCMAAVFVHFVIIVIICNLYLNTAIAFDLNNFFSLDYTTILAFVLLFALAIMHLLLVRFAVRMLARLVQGKALLVILGITLFGLLLLSMPWYDQYKIELLFSLIWLLAFTWYIATTRHPALPVASGRLVIWLFVYAASIGLLLSVLSGQRLRARVFDVGQNLLLQNDQTSEYLVRIASAGVRRLPWHSLLKECGDSARAAQIKDSVRNKYFGGYLDRYETTLYFFNKDQEPINNWTPMGYGNLNTLFTSQGISTDIPWLSYFEEAYDRFGYIMRFEVTEPGTNEPAGTVFIVTRYVLLRNAMLAPELFKQIQDFAVDLPSGFSYAWYRNGTLVEQYRNYPFLSALPKEMSGQQSIWENETESAVEVWINAEKDTVLAISGTRRVMIGLVSLVAYIFCAFLVLFIILRGGAALFQRTNLSFGLFRDFTLTIQAQIRLTIISILILSFLIIAYITISFFIGQYKSANEDRLARTIQNVYADLSLKIPDNFHLFSEKEQSAYMKEQLETLAKTADADINFFDRSGKLLATTQDVLFAKEVLGGVINPTAYHRLTYGKIHRFIAEERIGDLEYISIYQPLRDANRHLIGYLQVPYFASQSEVNQEISNFVVILINIIAFVFLLSGGLALWISGSITRSFSIIAERMKQIRLSEKNERIEWKSNDEIGNLVDQYNRMVDQLEQSAAMLAKSERESAWREMARQVAHEIKNPLTPMKLSLQYLQKTILENRGDIAKISDRVATTLVSQIDHLSRIASEFSQFANIGNTHPEIFDIHLVLKDLAQLYAMQDTVTIDWQPVSVPVHIKADKTQINRLFTNLLQNAHEARQEQQGMAISIQEKMDEHWFVVSIADNGPGIAVDVRERIFVPNFTTKTSGTGLGLAICKAIVENAQGDIWFETMPGKGTVFYVKFPLAEG